MNNTYNTSSVNTLLTLRYPFYGCLVAIFAQFSVAFIYATFLGGLYGNHATLIRSQGPATRFKAKSDGECEIQRYVLLRQTSSPLRTMLDLADRGLRMKGSVLDQS